MSKTPAEAEAEDAQQPEPCASAIAVDAGTPSEAPVTASDATAQAAAAPASIWTALPPAVSMSVLAAPGFEPATSGGEGDGMHEKDSNDRVGAPFMRSPGAAATITASPFRMAGSHGAPITVDVADDELLAAAAAHESGPGGSEQASKRRLDDGAGEGAVEAELRTAPTGCSTAWSLELLEAQPLGNDSGLGIVQPSKRQRRD